MAGTCPFCRNTLNNGATVCGACSAFMSCPLQQGGPTVPLFLLFLWGNYLLFGPGAFIGLLSSFGKDKSTTFSSDFTLFVITGLISVVGFWILRRISRWFGRPLWYRR